jgi:DNA-binding transcriptional ArsR family regulator
MSKLNKEQLNFNFGDLNPKKHKSSGNGGNIQMKRDYLFIREIPLEWSKAAGKIRGKASYMGERLWFLAGVNKSRTFDFSISKTTDNGISRSAASRGLKALENAGLVSVERLPGKKLIVTIFDVPKKAK